MTRMLLRRLIIILEYQTIPIKEIFNKMTHLRIFSLVLLLFLGLMFTISCNSCQSRKKIVMSEPYTQVSPQFNADSAYVFIEKQVAFGSREIGRASCRERV